MRKTNLLLMIMCFSIFGILFSGCRESDSTNDRQARLIGNQNLELKKKIEQQKNLLDKCQKENEDLRSKIDKTSLNFMKILTETHQENAKLKAENAELKEKVKQLEDKISTK